MIYTLHLMDEVYVFNRLMSGSSVFFFKFSNVQLFQKLSTADLYVQVQSGYNLIKSYCLIPIKLHSNIFNLIISFLLPNKLRKFEVNGRHIYKRVGVNFLKQGSQHYISNVSCNEPEIHATFNMMHRK